MTATVSAEIGRRVSVLRKKRGWSLVALARECAALGYGQLTKNALENIEYGRIREGQRRRRVTVEELMMLSHVLSVSPSYLLNGYIPGTHRGATGLLMQIAFLLEDVLDATSPATRAELSQVLGTLPHKCCLSRGEASG